MKLGVAPVLALFSHQRTELNAYAMQIAPTLVIADRQHTLFAGEDFLNTFVAEHRSVRVVLLRNDDGDHSFGRGDAAGGGRFHCHAITC